MGRSLHSVFPVALLFIVTLLSRPSFVTAATPALTNLTTIFRGRLSIGMATTTTHVTTTLAVAPGVAVAFGQCSSGMRGPIVSCYVPSTAHLAETVCVDLDGVNYDVARSESQTTVIMSVSTEPTTSSLVLVELATPLATLGLQVVDTKRFIFDFSSWNSVRGLPNEHGDSDKASGQVHITPEGSSIVLSIDGRANRNLTYIIVSIVAAGLIVLAMVAVRCLGVLVSPRQTLILQLGVVLVLLGFTTAVIVAGNRDFEALGSTAPLGSAFGEATAFLFSMLLIPTSKHVGIGVLIGSSYERMLWLHPLIACMLFGTMTVHFLAMDDIAMDGFLAWLLTAVILMVSLFFRRKSYWTFRAVHGLFVGVLALAVVHHPTLGVMLIPGLVLWALDLVLRCVSAYRAAATVQAATNQSCGTTTLELTVGWSEAPPPGSYAFLLIPTLSLVMHPFTVASFEPIEGSRGGGVATFHIKSEGVGPFTAALRSMVDRRSNSFRVFVFGPHGCLQVPLERCKRVVLLAGGIGITPMLSILQNLATTTYPMLEEVHLVWSAQNRAMVQRYCAALRLSNFGGGSCTSLFVVRTVHIHCTAGGSGEMVEHSTNANETGAAADTTTTIVSGRPQFDEYLKGWVAQYGQKATGVYVCGPPAMMESATAAAEASGSWLHAETFFF